MSEPRTEKRASAPRVSNSLSGHFSFYALVGTVIAVGVFFFHVVQPFLLPLFLAAVLALLFRPVHLWCTRSFNGHRHVAAAVVTVTVLLLGLLPLSGALFLVGQELFASGQELVEVDWRSQPLVADILDFVERHSDHREWLRWQESGATAVQSLTQVVYGRTRALVSSVVGFLVGLGIVALGLFYFLADGPALLQTLQRLSPLDDEDEQALFEEFDRVCRGVVLASVVTALTQAVLAGIGFAMMGIDRVWLLSGLTLFSSLIPFLGSAAVWLAVAAWLAVHGDYWTAAGICVWGGAVVSTSDNLIRAYVLHGAVNLHPLLALIGVLGGLRVVGLAGVLIGPIVAAFFYALLSILHERLQHTDAAHEEADEDSNRPGS